jgi:hypothetical protein
VRRSVSDCGKGWEIAKLVANKEEDTMGDIDDSEIHTFCTHCDWAHQCWQLRKYLYDNNPDEKALRINLFSPFFNRLAKILQEYWMLEVVKLHDRSVQQGNTNFSIDYILTENDWANDLRVKLTNLKEEMDLFVSKLRLARNKLLSHKDRAAIINSQTLGCFEEGEDKEYFRLLQEFTNEIHVAETGDPFLFDNLTPNDVEVFMNTFMKGLAKK